MFRHALLGFLALALAGPAAARDFEGFGADTKGGDGKEVIVVKTDADSGKDTLRAALEKANKSGGHIKFTRAMDIHIKDSLVLDGKNITLDGLSAGGVTIWADGLPRSRGNLVVEGSDIIIQGLRIRNGGDGIQVRKNAHKIVIDHCTVTCPGDGGIDITQGSKDVTVSYCWITGAGTPGGESGGGGAMLIKYGGTTRVSVHHNWFQNNLRRCPTVEEKNCLVDIRNNLVEDSAQTHMQIEAGDANIVNNVYVGGKATAISLKGDFYLSGNLAPDQKLPKSTAKAEFPAPKVKTLAAGEVKDHVMKNAGAPPTPLDKLYRESPSYQKTRDIKAKP